MHRPIGLTPKFYKLLKTNLYGVIHFWRPQENQVFDPSPVHMRSHEPDPSSLWTSTCGWHEIHFALLKQLVQWPSGPNAGIRLKCDCNLFKTVLLVIYITNIYRRKFSTFLFRPKTKFRLKMPTSLHEKKTGWCHWTQILYVDVHLELTPFRRRPPERDSLPPPCGRHTWMAPIAMAGLEATLSRFLEGTNEVAEFIENNRFLVQSKISVGPIRRGGSPLPSIVQTPLFDLCCIGPTS